MNLRLACLFALILALPASLCADHDMAAPAVGPGCFPGPIPYGYYAPYHPIYDYMPTWDPTYDRYAYGRYGDGRYGDGRYGEGRLGENRTGKVYPGRDQLYPALPYSDYLRSRRALIPTPPAEEPKLTTAADRALFEVRVPTEAARVWFNDQLAAGEGSVRYFSTPALTAGKEYRYKIKAAWPGSDPFQDVTAEQTVTFRAGEHKVVELKPKR